MPVRSGRREPAVDLGGTLGTGMADQSRLLTRTAAALPFRRPSGSGAARAQTQFERPRPPGGPPGQARVHGSGLDATGAQSRAPDQPRADRPAVPGPVARLRNAVIVSDLMPSGGAALRRAAGPGCGTPASPLLSTPRFASRGRHAFAGLPALSSVRSCGISGSRAQLAAERSLDAAMGVLARCLPLFFPSDAILRAFPPPQASLQLAASATASALNQHCGSRWRPGLGRSSTRPQAALVCAGRAQQATSSHRHSRPVCCPRRRSNSKPGSGRSSPSSPRSRRGSVTSWRS